MDRSLITWNVPNIVSVWLMAAVGFLVVGIGAQLLMGKFGAQDQGTETGGGF